MFLNTRRKLISMLAGKMPVCLNVKVLENARANNSSDPSVGLAPSDDGIPKAVFTKNFRVHKLEG